MLAHVYPCVKVCSLCVQMSQVNPGFFSTLNLKSELESGQAADSSDAAQYLSRLIKRPAPDKSAELWRTYLRRYAWITRFSLPDSPDSWLPISCCVTANYSSLPLLFLFLPNPDPALCQFSQLLFCPCHVWCLSLVSDVEIKHLARTSDIMCKARPICHSCFCTKSYHVIQALPTIAGPMERRICLELFCLLCYEM